MRSKHRKKDCVRNGKRVINCVFKITIKARTLRYILRKNHLQFTMHWLISQIEREVSYFSPIQNLSTTYSKECIMHLFFFVLSRV